MFLSEKGILTSVFRMFSLLFYIFFFFFYIYKRLCYLGGYCLHFLESHQKTHDVWSFHHKFKNIL